MFCPDLFRQLPLVSNPFLPRIVQAKPLVKHALHERPCFFPQRVLVFACNWCSYAGADFAGVSRFQYPPNARLIRTMCLGRVSEKFVWRAFEKGSPVVLVSGCHIGDCHYLNADHWTEHRIKRIQKKMEKMGLRAERLQLEWISAAEGLHFKEVMEKMERLRQSVTEQEVAETQRILKDRSVFPDSELQ